MVVASGKKLTRCKECRGPVVANYDHVGDCETNCTGTFEHPDSTKICRYRFRDLTHDLVEVARS